MKRFIARLLIFTLTCLLFLELVFRFILPASELPASIQIEGGFPVYDQDYQRSGYWSAGRIPTERFHWTVNDQGWVSMFQYEPREERDRPLIAMIGDSHIVSMRCDVEEQVDAWLFQILEGEFDVYNFGRGGQTMIQMMMLMDMIDSLYKPDIYV